MREMHSPVPACVALCCSLLLSAAAEVTEPASRPLRIAAEDYPPYEYIEDGVPKGIDVDVFEKVFGKLGIEYEIEFYPFTRGWLMLTKGMADAAPSISYQPFREPHLFYTDAQREFARTGRIPEDYLWMTEYVFFVLTRNRDKFRFETYEQLRADKPRIGTNRDYSYDDDFLNAKLSVREVNDTKEGLSALVTGEIDLYPMDKTVGIATLQEMGLRDSVTFLPRPLFSKPYLAPFVRTSDYPGLENLMHDFYRELRELRESGEYETILQKEMDRHYADQ
ncbi:MAG: transporter substrate-binding domain-containing protein [Lentisphaerae bacterium]|nr:transporter substrate-binding domain-containing protein [Lentisphaerota bacterium]